MRIIVVILTKENFNGFVQKLLKLIIKLNFNIVKAKEWEYGKWKKEIESDRERKKRENQ